MCDDKGKDEDGEEGQREDEHVEETVVPPSHAVSHPGTVVVKPLCMDRERHKYLFWIQGHVSFTFHHGTPLTQSEVFVMQKKSPAGTR